MRVSHIDAIPLAIPLDQEFHWSGGAQAGANLVLFAVRTDDGVVGYGESEHLERLKRSARAIDLEVPLGIPELLDVVKEGVLRSELIDAHVGPIVTRGFGAPGLDPWRCEHPSLIVAAHPFPPLLGTDSLRLMVSSIVRKAPRSLGAHVMSLNYLDAIVAKQQARAAGMHDAVMLDALGAVAECTSTNIFLLIDNELVTPTTRAALPGITRRTILELASETGVPVQEREVWPMELYTADAMFVTGSGVVPVGEVDGCRIPTADNPTFVQLAAAYRERTRDDRFLVKIAASGDVDRLRQSVAAHDRIPGPGPRRL